MQIRANYQPIIDPPRRVPFSLHGSLRDAIDRMVKLNVNTRVKDPTDWVNSVVLLRKAKGELRLRLDQLNLKI